MALREEFTNQLKTSMKAGDAARTSTLRMILAKLKDTDIAARKSPQDPGVPEEQIVSMLRGMAKSRGESVTLYRQGNRPELAQAERDEITVIQSFMPKQMSDEEAKAAVAGVIAAVGATSVKDMGKVMAELKAKFAGQMDMGKAGGIVKALLG